MKILKYFFNDHFKTSSDKFRKYFGFYYDFKDNNITLKSNPQKIISFGHIMEYGVPELINEEKGLYKQKVKCLINNTPENKEYLDSLEPIDPNAGDTIRLTIKEAIQQTFKDESKLYKDYNFKTFKLNSLKSKIDEFEYANIQAEYNFFIKNYEELIKNDVIPEEVLPNYYVVSLALNRDILSSISQNDYNNEDIQTANSPYIDFQKKFDKYITLDNNILLNPPVLGTTVSGLLFGLTMIAYCEQYAEIYDNVSIDYIQTAKRRFSNFLNNIPNKELLNSLNEFKISYPMYCNIEWATPTLSPLLTFLNNANISLESFQQFIQDKLIIENQPTVQPSNNNGLFIFDPNFAFLTAFQQLEDLQNGSLITESSSTLFAFDILTWINEFINSLLNGNVEQFNIPEVPENASNTEEIDIPVANPGQFGVSPNDAPSAPSLPGFETPRAPNDVPNFQERFQRNAIRDRDSLSLDLSRGIDLRQDLEEAVNLENIINIVVEQTNLQDLLLSSFRNYEDLINGELSKTDILFYRIEKRDKDNQLIQSFYVPNVNGVDVLNYVDTQVKYNKEYRYKIFSNIAVHGTEYYYKPEPLPSLEDEPNVVGFTELLEEEDNVVNIEPLLAPAPSDFAFGAPSIPTFIPPNNVPNNVPNNFGNIEIPSSNPVLDIIVENKEEPKQNIEELLDFGDNLGVGNFGGENQNNINVNPNSNIIPETSEDLQHHQSSVRDLDDILTKGFNFIVYYYPVVKLIETEYSIELKGKIIDNPPTPPIAEFYPIKDCNNKFKLILSPSSGEIKQFPQPITEQDDLYFKELQEQRNYSDGKIVFEYEGDISLYNIYRTTEPPQNYKSFWDNSLVDTRRTIKNIENVMLDEYITPNIDYYYTFTTEDYHGHRSNPSPVFKIKLYSNEGIEYLDVQAYEFPIQKDIISRKFKKFIKLKPSILQTVYNSLDEKVGILKESLFEKTFLMRIQSKHSGKKIDLVLKFKKEDKI